MNIRLIRSFLAGLLLLVGLAVPGTAGTLSPDQKAAVEQTVRDYLLDHPEVLVQALQAFERKQKEAAALGAHQVIGEKREALLADPSSPVGGNPKGDVTIVEFFDYRCPYCKQVEPALEALLKEDTKLRIVYKEFPILGPPSVIASRVALAAQRQGKYDAFHRSMMARKGQIDEKTVLEVAAASGLDLQRLKADMAAPETDAILKRNMELAEALTIEGTPAFIIGDTLAPGAADIDTLRKLVAAARQSR